MRPAITRAKVSLALLLACWGLTSAGCGSSSRHDEGNVENNTAPLPENVQRSWYVVEMQGSKVGFRCQTVCELQFPNERLRQIESIDELVIKRLGQETKQQIRAVALETLDGQVRSLEYEVQLGQTPQKTRASVQGDQLVLIRDEGGKPTTTTLPWSSDIRGYFAVQQSLQEKPMQPGEQRQLTAILPLLDHIATTTLVAGEYETIAEAADSEQLLKITETLTLPDGNTMQGTLWVDESGEVQKQAQEPLVVRLATREEALGAGDTEAIDLVADVLVPVDRPIPFHSMQRRIVYEVTLADGDPAKLFPASPAQQVESIDDHTARITVLSVSPDLAPGDKTPPTPADSAPSMWIESDHPAIVRFATKAATAPRTTWLKAKAIEDFVFGFVTEKGYSQAFSSAAEVLALREGDCTEHAVLLAALCRAKEIPCRVAMGLVYVPDRQAFAYHMWNEAWIDDQWIPLDATQGRGGVASDHLKLAHSSLDGPASYASFLPVLQVLGRLEIKIVETQLTDGDEEAEEKPAEVVE